LGHPHLAAVLQASSSRSPVTCTAAAVIGTRRLLLTGCGDGSAKLWDLGSHKKLLQVQHCEGPLLGVALVTPVLLLTASANGALLWREGQRKRRFLPDVVRAFNGCPGSLPLTTSRPQSAWW
jgi:hypothetical protein